MCKIFAINVISHASKTNQQFVYFLNIMYIYVVAKLLTFLCFCVFVFLCVCVCACKSVITRTIMCLHTSVVRTTVVVRTDTWSP